MAIFPTHPHLIQHSMIHHATPLSQMCVTTTLVEARQLLDLHHLAATRKDPFQHLVSHI